VRVTDEFMKRRETTASGTTKASRRASRCRDVSARELMREDRRGGTHVCGDPGMQYDTTINEWHTVQGDGRINAVNPCSEYMFLDDSACNLASLNLMKFVKEDGEFDVESFKHASTSSSPRRRSSSTTRATRRRRSAKNSHAFRPLGLGYANLGALLMSRGLPYDSDGRPRLRAAITALMTGEAYRAVGAKIAATTAGRSRATRRTASRSSA
jgi:ribonucleoside-diphosphate reductase alpha chain